MRQWFLALSVLALMTKVYAQDEKDTKAFCHKRCFYYCKDRNLAVENCELTNVTSISFDLNCQCRNLKEGEKLPDVAPDYLINGRSGIQLD
jgi:hypothetical protein